MPFEDWSVARRPDMCAQFFVPGWVKCELQEWSNAAATDRGKLFRRVNKAGKTWKTADGKIGVEHREGVFQGHRSR